MDIAGNQYIEVMKRYYIYCSSGVQLKNYIYYEKFYVLELYTMTSERSDGFHKGNAPKGGLCMLNFNKNTLHARKYIRASTHTPESRQA